MWLVQGLKKKKKDPLEESQQNTRDALEVQGQLHQLNAAGLDEDDPPLQLATTGPGDKAAAPVKVEVVACSDTGVGRLM